MALLLCIDTAMEKASVGLANADNIVSAETSTDQKKHAVFVQAGIQKILHEAALSFNSIDAVAVVNGPGSYTGLRVGLASAKGLCYAAGKPLILLNTLTVMAKAAIDSLRDVNMLYCPMVDARRNEVFTAVYDASLQPLLPPQAMIVDENSFVDILKDKKVCFFGSGHNKCNKLIKHENALFTEIPYTLRHINELAQQMYLSKLFSDIAYAGPFYLKNFFVPDR